MKTLRSSSSSLNHFIPTSKSHTPVTSIAAVFFQSELSATLDKSKKKPQPFVIDETDCRVSPHLWRQQPQTGHARRRVPLDRKCFLVNRKVDLDGKTLSATGEEQENKSDEENTKNATCNSELQ